MAEVITGLPGIRTERSAAMRKVRQSDQGAMYLPGGKVIVGADSRDPLNTGDLDVLRAGMVMGKNSTSKKLAPSILGVLTAAHDADNSSGNLHLQMTVSAATAVELVRRIGTSGTFKVTGPPTAAGTVATETVTYSAVNTTTGVITISATSADFISGSFIQDTDGTETPLCLVDDGWGIKVTDQDAASLDVQFPMPLIGGILDVSQIINWPSDTSLITWLKEKLNDVDAGAGKFVFDDAF